MLDESPQSPIEHAVDVMIRHGVEFIVIGGQAEVLHDGNRVTFDIDFCYRRTKPNLERLAVALREIKPRLRSARCAARSAFHNRCSVACAWFKFNL